MPQSACLLFKLHGYVAAVSLILPNMPNVDNYRKTLQEDPR